MKHILACMYALTLAAVCVSASPAFLWSHGDHLRSAGEHLSHTTDLSSVVSELVLGESKTDEESVLSGLVARTPRVVVVANLPQLRLDLVSKLSAAFDNNEGSVLSFLQSEVESAETSCTLTTVTGSPTSLTATLSVLAGSKGVNVVAAADDVSTLPRADYESTLALGDVAESYTLSESKTDVLYVQFPLAASEESMKELYATFDNTLREIVGRVSDVSSGDFAVAVVSEDAPSKHFITAFTEESERDGARFEFGVRSSFNSSSSLPSSISSGGVVEVYWTPGFWTASVGSLIFLIAIYIAICCMMGIQTQEAFENPKKVGPSSST